MNIWEELAEMKLEDFVRWWTFNVGWILHPTNGGVFHGCSGDVWRGYRWGWVDPGGFKKFFAAHGGVR